MEETKDDLIEYFHAEKIERINGCIISMREHKNVDAEKLLEEHPELKDKYVYLKGIRVLVDKQRAAQIDNPTGIAALAPEDVITLNNSGVLENPNIHFNLILRDAPENSDRPSNVSKFRQIRAELGNNMRSISNINVYGPGYGLLTRIDNWTDEELIDFCSKIPALTINLTQPIEAIDRLRDVIFSNPELNEHFLVDGNYIVNVDKASGIEDNDGISFDRNPEEPESLRWKKLAKFIQKNKGCAVEERIRNLSEIPDEILDTIDESSRIKFVIQLGKDGKKQDYIYSAYEIKLIKEQITALEKGIASGWTDKDLTEFLGELDFLDFNFIQDEMLASRIKLLLNNISELKNKFLMLEEGTRVVNCEATQPISRVFTFPKDQSMEDDSYSHKVATFVKNNPGQTCRIKISGLKDLDVEDLETLSQHENSVKIGIPKGQYDPNNTFDVYNPNEMLTIRKKMDELLAGIDPNAPEMRRCGEIYRRVCNAFTYDYPAVYPKTPEEEEYSQRNSVNCRNLRNAFLEGKCVCAGYADVLRQAFNMFGIEAEYVVGDCIDQPISEAKYNKHKDDEEYKFKRVIKNEDGKVTLGDRHAWVKAKIDGKWYNFDPTFDADSYAREGIPKYVFLSDDEISDHGNSRISMTGPECKDSMPIYTQPPQFIKADEVEHKEEKKPSVVGKLFTVLFEKIRNTFKRKDQKLLDSGQQEGSMPNAGAMKKTEEQYPSWDLRGYKDAKKIIAPQQISTKDRNLDGKEKDDGR